MGREKPALDKSYESTSSDRPAKLPSKKHHGKHGRKKLVLRTAEGSEREEARIPERVIHATDLVSSGEWPVDTKNDSAGAPVRKEPEVVKVEKKESKKSKKRDKKPKIKDHHGERIKELLQQSSSDNNKESEKVTADCTTKRNLHFIKTERVGRKSDEERNCDESEDGKKKRKKDKKRRSNEKEKKMGSGEKMEDGKENPQRRKVDLASIHVDKEPPPRPKVELGSIKVKGYHDVERKQLYNIIPQYENLPEDTLVKKMQNPPENPNPNPVKPLTNTTWAQDTRTSTITEPTEKKAATEREKKDPLTISGPTEWSVSEKPSKMAEFKRKMKNVPWWLWIILFLIFGLCIIFAVTTIVLNRIYTTENADLKKKLEELTSGKTPFNVSLKNG